MENIEYYQNRRQYIRLDTVFPVEFRIVSQDGKNFFSDWLQGFTNNISKGGICLEVNKLSPQYHEHLKGGSAKIALNIELPITHKQIPATAKVAWHKEIATEPPRCIFGLTYEAIGAKDNKLLMHYAWTKRLFVPMVVGIIAILGVVFFLGSYLNYKLIKGNKALVEQLVNIVQESSIAKQKVKEINREREVLELKIQELEARIQNVEGEKQQFGKITNVEKMSSEKKIKDQKELIQKLNEERVSLQSQLLALQDKESMVTEDLLRLDKKKANLERENLDKMYQWLKTHQNHRTGLVVSFEGDTNLANWAFIYDQSLVLQAFINFEDFDRARALLNFFAKSAKREGKLFLNAYYVLDGSPAEYSVHSGPNIWLGIAVLQYSNKLKDRRYFYLAEEIADGVIALQDKDGGIRGGPNVEWFSTEHNLDAYAFFNMLYVMNGNSRYKDARDKTLGWLVSHTYDKAEIPIKRGKGDSTIATDTYAWSIAAIGPQKLDELGMNPDRIMEFAEKNCCKEVIFSRPEGYAVKVKGFDFAPEKNLARGGVVSSEWTAQMVVSLRIMAEYYYKKGLKAKGHAYAVKADEYLASLGKMIISSPSASGQGESCLPYATQDFVDTGHGWMTPKGNSTGCIAGTAYTLFAYYDYNPLELSR